MSIIMPLEPPLSTLISTIVGGLIAIGGTLVGPPFLHRLQRAAERKKRRAEKLEELAVLEYEHRLWLDTLREIKLFDSEEKIVLSPMAKIRAISAIYFPELEELVSNLSRKAAEYQLWIVQERQKKLAGKSKYGEDIGTVDGPYLDAFYALQDRIRTLARDELH
jgi:hypothetical protein